MKVNRIADLEQKLLEATQSHDVLVDEHHNLRDELIKTQGRLKECNDRYHELAYSFKDKGEIPR